MYLRVGKRTQTNKLCVLGVPPSSIQAGYLQSGVLSGDFGCYSLDVVTCYNRNDRFVAVRYTEQNLEKRAGHQLHLSSIRSKKDAIGAKIDGVELTVPKP